MSKPSAIKVGSCYECVKHQYVSGCRIKNTSFSGIPIPPACPLPKWPSIARKKVEEQTEGWLAKFDVGNTAADPLRIETLATPLVIEMLKSIGVEIEDGD